MIHALINLEGTATVKSSNYALLSQLAEEYNKRDKEIIDAYNEEGAEICRATQTPFHASQWWVMWYYDGAGEY